MPMAFDIADKIILVTGANRGIGKVLVESFLDHGAAKVYAAVRKLASAEPLVEQYGDKVVPTLIDLAEPQSITAAAQIAMDVEVVVNNAGVQKVANPLAEEAIAYLKFEMETNVYGLIAMAQAFAPILQANGGGAFVQLNSVVSLKSLPNIATYSASKAAAYSITQALQELLRRQNTLVLSVHPGPIATEMTHASGRADIAESPTLVAEAIISGLQSGEFHVFPNDTMAKEMGNAYRSFAKNVVEVSFD
ncbi:SDR family oxidoreductase [Synechocystis sp. CS-94]|nr:SDR family oxidoreductase [Synechocystis sp. CS-94]